MPTDPPIFSQYYLPHEQQMSQHQHSYNQQHIQLLHHEQHVPQSMQPPPSPNIPIDPALALYSPNNYYSQQYQQQHHSQHQHPQQLSLAPSLSSPSSQASESISTPPTEQMSFAGPQKRPSSASTTDAEGRKRPRKDEEPEAGPSNGAKPGEPKTKPTRGSR